MSLKDRIREAMELRPDLKKGEFAKQIGISGGALSQILNGDTKTLMAETAVEMERITGFRAYWLVKGKGSKKLFDSAACPLQGDLVVAILEMSEEDRQRLEKLIRLHVGP